MKTTLKKKTATKRAPARKPAPKKKSPIKKTVAKKSTVKKPTVRKTVAKKPTKAKTTKKPTSKARTSAKKKTSKTTTKKKAKPKEVPLGRTLKTKDEFLPFKKTKVKELKDKRLVVVIDKNTREELAVVKLTTKSGPNTSELTGYKKGNKKTTFFSHFVEITDSKGNPITVDGVRFKENYKKYDLNSQQVSQIRKKVRGHSKQALENRKKLLDFKK